MYRKRQKIINLLQKVDFNRKMWKIINEENDEQF